jgi:hypothetical protein
MRNRQNLFRLFVFTVLVIALTTLTACEEKEKEQFDDEASALATNVVLATQTASAPTTPEAGDEKPAEESSEAAMPEIDLGSLEDYVSVTEFFRLKIPEGWGSMETFPGGALIMANSAAALEWYNSDSPAQSGDLVMNVGFLPYDLFRQREVVPLNIQFDATPDLFLQSIMPIFNVAEGAVLGDTQLVSLNDEREAGSMIISSPGREGLVLLYPAGDEVVALVSTVGYPGEIDAYREAIYAIAAEVSFSGAHEALYGTYLGG